MRKASKVSARLAWLVCAGLEWVLKNLFTTKLTTGQVNGSLCLSQRTWSVRLWGAGSHTALETKLGVSEAHLACPRAGTGARSALTHLSVNRSSVEFLETDTGNVSTSPGRAVLGR